MTMIEQRITKLHLVNYIICILSKFQFSKYIKLIEQEQEQEELKINKY